MKNTFTLIAKTKDGKPCYWGKKESDDPESRDLTLWIALGKPKPDASNYYRVPPQDESFYISGQGDWNAHMKNKIEDSTSADIKKWVKCSW